MSETSDSTSENDIRLPRFMSFLPAQVQNPFVHKLKLSTMDKIQIGVMSCTIVPLRLVGILICVMFGWVFATVTLHGLTEEQLKEPLTGWRRRMHFPLRFVGRAVLFLCGFHSIKIRGHVSTPQEAPVVACAPHSTFFDSSMLCLLHIMPSGVSRAENAAGPMGALTKFTQPVLVSREDPDSRAHTIGEIKRRARSGGEWPQIVIFPEGTCTNRSCLIAFKPGAFYPGVPVQPVCLKYKNKLDTITWTWDGPDALHVLWYTLCQFDNRLEVEFLPVYTPDEEEIADPKLFSRNVRERMAQCLGVPTTDHCFEDCRLMLYANKINFPAAAGLIEFHKISKKLGMNYENIQELLAKFTQIAQAEKNAVTIDELANYLDLPVKEPLEQMFALYDRDGSGTIDFREYVIGLHLVALPANTEETINFAFEVFDKGNKGYIVEEELCDILHNAFSMDYEAARNLFKSVDADSNGKVTLDEFKEYAKKKPEYARLFIAYHEMEAKKTVVDTPVENEKERDDASNKVPSITAFIRRNTIAPMSVTHFSDSDDDVSDDDFSGYSRDRRGSFFA